MGQSGGQIIPRCPLGFVQSTVKIVSQIGQAGCRAKQKGGGGPACFAVASAHNGRRSACVSLGPAGMGPS